MTESSGAHSLEKRSPSEEEQDLPESLAEVEFSGVRAIEATASEITPVLKYFIFSGVFLIGYIYGLDGSVRSVYQASATSSYSQHSLLATINVLKGIIAAAAQPPLAKIADLFGRIELIIVGVFFYTLGTIVEACANDVKTWCGGAVLHQIGLTSLILLLEVTIGDITSTRSRVFFSYIPALPFLINAWVSGDVASVTLANAGWRWGVAMWTVILPVCSLVMLVPLFIARRRASKSGKLADVKRKRNFKEFLIHLFWDLDVVGIILLIALLSLTLLPLTLAGGESQSWKKPRIGVMLAIGLLCIPAFAFWELKFARSPCVPFHLLNDRTVLGCMGMACMLNTSWYLQGDYLYTILIVAFNQSVKSATRISSLYSFTSVITGVLLGIVIRYVRRLKPFILAGIGVYMIAFGILIRYRGGNVADTAGMIGGQVVLGVAGGMFPYPAQALIQTATQHQHLAVITSLYLASQQVGSAFGNTISGALWTQLLPGKLRATLGDPELVTLAYGSPFEFVAAYPMGTPERRAVVEAYQQTQRILCITGICLVIPLFIFAAVTRNPELTNEQSLEEAEGGKAAALRVHKGVWTAT